jgi:hypothetical protein
MKILAIFCLVFLSIINYCSCQDNSTCVWPTPTSGKTSTCGPGSLMLTFGLYLTPFVAAHVIIFYVMVRKFYNDGDSDEK